MIYLYPENTKYRIMNTEQAIKIASNHLAKLKGRTLDLVTINKPSSIEAAINLTKIISKLSPILGNMIEFNTVEFLNELKDFSGVGQWKRQDPGFPDAIFQGSILPAPGFEIKAWFPLATEITARFRDSQNSFKNDETYVVLLAWLPEYLIFGKPQIIDVGIFSGQSIAKARDDHYHQPPDYLVIEPEDTSDRTLNLQQTNTRGYKWQGTDSDRQKAIHLINSWGNNVYQYQPSRGFRAQLQNLIRQFRYREDSNYAKIDRINHPGIENFKTQVLSCVFQDKTISEWENLFKNNTEETLTEILLKFGKGSLRD
ncbi:MAG: hypothetical protein IJK97_13495 [Thermoguttaceae bacterium]|nr:hypothetical protein [Thermoguttaceae bacterium]